MTCDVWSVMHAVWWALRLEHCVLVNIFFFIGSCGQVDRIDKIDKIDKL